MTKLPPPLEIRKRRMSIAGVSLGELASRHGTPVYVTSEKRVRDNYRRFCDTFRSCWHRFRAFYAVKANSNLSIMSVLRQEGAGADCSGIQELQLASMAKFKIDDMLYTGVYNSDEELKFASQLGVTVNLDDIGILERLVRFGLPKRLSFRINPGFGKSEFKEMLCAGPESKFGVPEEVAWKCYAKAKRLGVKRFGIHMMSGSSVLDLAYFNRVTDRLFEIASSISERVGIEFEFVDIGGGFGVPHRPSEKPLDMAKLAAAVTARFKERFEDYVCPPYLYAEPGRYLIADSTVLLTRVNAVKHGKKRFVGVDAGMNTLLRPALYGAYHEMLVVGKSAERKKEKVDIVGPICENGDILAKDRLMPVIEKGDLIAIMNAGAYGYSMSSNYNARPRAAEVLVSNGEDFLIREREDITDILDRQRIPGRLLR
jgi:diaminopimelate decarboxylase